MALIRTVYGDTNASVKLSRGGLPSGSNLVPFMEVTEIIIFTPD